MKTLALVLTAVSSSIGILHAEKMDPKLEAHLSKIKIVTIDPQSVPKPPPPLKIPQLTSPAYTPAPTQPPVAQADGRPPRIIFPPTEAEIIADETRRIREEMEYYRQLEEQRIRMEQQREFYRQQRAFQQRAIDSANRAARRR